MKLRVKSMSFFDSPLQINLKQVLPPRHRSPIPDLTQRRKTFTNLKPEMPERKARVGPVRLLEIRIKRTTNLGKRHYRPPRRRRKRRLNSSNLRPGTNDDMIMKRKTRPGRFEIFLRTYLYYNKLSTIL